MSKRFLGMSMVGALVLLVISASAFVAQRPRNRPVAQPAPPKDLKIKYRMTTAGQCFETTTMIKGSRERGEMHTGYGMDTVNITQCDLKRMIQINDSVKKYVITPMDVTASSDAGGGSVPTSNSGQPSRRGGVVTYVTTANDTGERKEMFGFTARHVKTSMVTQSSPDACNPMKQKIETDGWYVDLAFGPDCDLGRTQAMARRPVSPGGCQDRVQFRREGSARTGYPLIETVTMYGPDGNVTFSTTKEVLQLSREPLDASLFDVPAGYTEATSTQELYGMPSTGAQMPQDRQRDDDGSNLSNGRNAKAPGTIRVGVVQINNKTDRQVSTESLRERLVGNIQGGGIEAISLNATSPGEAEAEAKVKQCDFILYTDITALKTSAAKKVGGMFGRVAGVGGIDKTESKVEFRLFAVSEPSPRLQSSAAAKEEGEEASAGTAIDQEAKMVSAEARKKNRS